MAIYCASYINVREDDALLVENYDAIWCRLLYANREVVLGCRYHTEPTDDENFANCLYKLSTGNMEKIVAADFNHQSIDWEALSCSGSIADQRFLDMVQDNFLSQHVVDPTRGQHVLDLLMSSEPDLITECIVEGNIGSTDHNTVIFSAAIKQRNLNERSFSRRNFWKMDAGSLLSDLKGYDWNSLLIGDAEQQWNMLMGTLNDLISKHVPFVERRKRKYPWIAKQVLRACKDKRRCWKNLQSNNSVENELKYMQAKRASDQSVEWSKKDFERKLAKGIREDSKSFWRYFSAKKKCPTKVGPLKEGDRVIEKSEDLAEHLNSYFQSVFTQEPIGPVPYAERRTNFKMPNISITVDMVLAQLLNLRVDKAAGPDGIPPLFLKLAAPGLAEPLTKIFRESLSSGVVPTGWKVANVSALFKKGKRSEAANYRPVSLTSVICKCFERIVQQSVIGHLKEHNLISDTQHGFMKGRSCLLSLLAFFENKDELLDKRMAVDVLYLDFAKAFDKVPHRRLVEKMRAHGLSEEVIKWVEAWLKDRKQRVVIDQCYSSWETVFSGVPQGTVLGPTLFLIFINDNDDSLADDSKLVGPSRNLDDRAKLQRDLDLMKA